MTRPNALQNQSQGGRCEFRQESRPVRADCQNKQRRVQAFRLRRTLSLAVISATGTAIIIYYALLWAVVKPWHHHGPEGLISITTISIKGLNTILSSFDKSPLSLFFSSASILPIDKDCAIRSEKFPPPTSIDRED